MALFRLTNAFFLVLKGILYKQGAKGIVKGWKKRWFSLKNNTQIHYYKSAEELQSLGFIDANAITSIRETPNTGLRRDRGEYLFEVCLLQLHF